MTAGATQAVLSQSQPVRSRSVTSFLGPSATPQWVKVTGGASLDWAKPSGNFPNDFWGQVDVWIPPETFTACDGDLLGFSANFVDFGNDSLLATDASGWKWLTDYGTVAATGPSPSTTYTIKFHYVYTSGSFATVTWYVDGVVVATDTTVSHFNQHLFFLNHFPEGCCCEVYFYTNVRLGTTSGGSEIFADDFSGGLGNWTIHTSSPNGVVSVVAAPSSGCPTLTVGPEHGQAGTLVTFTGGGFAADSPLTIYIGSQLIEVAETTDGSGNFHFTIPLPEGIPSTFFGDSLDVTVVDGDGNVGCGAPLFICGPRGADGIATAVPAVLATGGLTDNSNAILDYIFHDGAHWVLWQDTSVVEGAGTFPPPANHTINATRISADGSSVVDYPIDTNYHWIFGGGAINDEGLFSTRTCPGSGGTVSAPVWSQISFFAGWDKPIYDAHFASDGATLWVAVLTRETIPYPWLDNQDACSPNPGSAAQFVPLATLTSGFTTFATDTSTGYHRWNTQTTGPIDIYQPDAFPVTDAGEEDMGYWSPPIVAVFSFDGGAFNRIGEIDAAYAPGQTRGSFYGTAGSIIGQPALVQKTQRGTLISRVSICAHPNDPGRCHVVWSEGGDWGRQGLSNGIDCSRLVWDAGPQNRGYRVNYTTWGSGGKLTDVDLFTSHVDRTNWDFPNDDGGGGEVFATGYTWPDQADFAGLLAHDLRNDNPAGTPYLFAVWPQSFQNVWNPSTSEFAPAPAYIDPHGNPWLDNSILFGDTLHVYDLGGGGAVEVQTLDLSTLGTSEAELETLYSGSIGPPFAAPVGPADCIYSPRDVDDGASHVIASYGPVDKAFGLSLPYEDPELGVPVYLVHIPIQKRWIPQSASPADTLNKGYFVTRNFYRVPCDMGTAFDYLDGQRMTGFTVVKAFNLTFEADAYGSSDFFSDPKNIWVPEASGFGSGFGGYSGEWFDRVCANQWQHFSAAWEPFVADYWLGAQCRGFHYDAAADSITTVTAASADETLGGPLFAVATQFICRGCRHCKCGTGVHIAHRF